MLKKEDINYKILLKKSKVKRLKLVKNPLVKQASCKVVNKGEIMQLVHNLKTKLYKIYYSYFYLIKIKNSNNN